MTTFLLGFCFKNLDLLDKHSPHLDLSLSTLFVIVNVFEPILLVCFLQAEKISFQFHFYNVRNMCLTKYFKHFVFMEIFDLNFSLNNWFESSSIKGFLVDSSVNFLVNLVM